MLQNSIISFPEATVLSDLKFKLFSALYIIVLLKLGRSVSSLTTVRILSF